MNTVMGIKGNDKHYYSALGWAQGENAAFSQSTNIFKHLGVHAERKHTCIFSVFSARVLLYSHCCVLYLCSYFHIFFYGCLSDSGSLCGATVSEKNPFSHPVDSITVSCTSWIGFHFIFFFRGVPMGRVFKKLRHASCRYTEGTLRQCTQITLNEQNVKVFLKIPHYVTEQQPKWRKATVLFEPVKAWEVCTCASNLPACTCDRMIEML